MNNSYSIPIDLTIEILSRLPTKSVARFRCVSKLWSSIIDRPYFNELFLTRSSAKPRLLFATAEHGVWSFFSLPQSSSTDLIVTAEFHLKFSQDDMRHRDIPYFPCGYASGLFFFYGGRYDDAPVVCNPNTGGYATLPFLTCYKKPYSFFMFEPIDKQYKVLLMAYPSGPEADHHKILTLGTGDTKWRTIKCSLRHDIWSDGICINGVFYYLGRTKGCVNDALTSDYVIVCFDVRSEKFTFIGVNKTVCEPINYKGKLAVVYWEDDVELHVWVLEDVEKQEWSKYAYILRDDKFSRHYDVSIAGMTAWGEIVLSMRKYSSKQPFYVFYFNLEKKNLRRVEIQGFGEAFCNIDTFVDHVEDLNVHDPKLLKSFQSTEKKKEYSEYSYSDSE